MVEVVRKDISFIAFVVGISLFLAVMERVIVNELGQGLTMAIAVGLILFGYLKNNV